MNLLNFHVYVVCVCMCCNTLLLYYGLCFISFAQLSRVSSLLGTSVESLSHALTHKTVTTNNEATETKLSVSQACYTRDSLAKVHVYTKYTTVDLGKIFSSRKFHVLFFLCY